MNSFGVFIIIILILGIIGVLIRTLLKFIISIIIILILFRLGFLWSASDINEKLNLKNFFSEKHRPKVETTIKDLRKRVNENSMIDTNKLYEDATSLVKQKIQEQIKQK